jgi:hypothetical protein
MVAIDTSIGQDTRAAVVRMITETVLSGYAEKVLATVRGEHPFVILQI